MQTERKRRGGGNDNVRLTYPVTTNKIYIVVLTSEGKEKGSSKGGKEKKK